jgi:hypothetical protein
MTIDALLSDCRAGRLLVGVLDGRALSDGPNDDRLEVLSRTRERLISDEQPEPCGV